MKINIESIFNQYFEGIPVIVRSPGRINIIGEHIDYNSGFVLPAAIDKYIYVAIDGVAPMGKILQQRQRRYRFLFDKKIKLNTNVSSINDMDDCISRTVTKSNGIEEPVIPISSIELTPGTDYMERINKCMEKYMEELGKRGIGYQCRRTTRLGNRSCHLFVPAVYHWGHYPRIALFLYYRLYRHRF